MTISAAGTKRQQFNSLIAGLSSSVDAMVTFSADPNVGAIGANPNTGATYPNANFTDVTHPYGGAATPNGYSRMAAIATPAMTALA